VSVRGCDFVVSPHEVALTHDMRHVPHSSSSRRTTTAMASVVAAPSPTWGMDTRPRRRVTLPHPPTGARTRPEHGLTDHSFHDVLTRSVSLCDICITVGTLTTAVTGHDSTAQHVVTDAAVGEGDGRC
jgi:hypothetical protein